MPFVLLKGLMMQMLFLLDEAYWSSRVSAKQALFDLQRKWALVLPLLLLLPGVPNSSIFLTGLFPRCRYGLRSHHPTTRQRISSQIELKSDEKNMLTNWADIRPKEQPCEQKESDWGEKSASGIKLLLEKITLTQQSLNQYIRWIDYLCLDN